ncbi:flagellar basal-body rod modification protein FlgD [Bacillus mesophilus]|uniref:Flagellar hook assembly protein FlgD n=1 Tax=Bacillus mesophilus TaxID=1808955 RepID=A0A6M0Q1M6_9BACI|nr:flagellar hook assembly protein FlgD [Bacillus mesophilus]MBM7659359.1 flagellar basal-body rod modification protein FlgD [Bacillus mesophilus]NEY70231.1 flagellar hook assembly protein FlgD [Bacillus mesophilus]
MTINLDPTLYLKNQAVQKSKSDVMGKDDFLRILMTQLQNQDPMNPMQDKDFIAQMATFTSLEQMTNMNKMLEQFITSQKSDNIMKYSEMIGKQVEFTSKSVDENGNEIIESKQGIVKSIYQKNLEVQLEMEDGTTILPNALTKITSPASN